MSAETSQLMTLPRQTVGATRHLLTLSALGPEWMRGVLDLSHRMKRSPGKWRGVLAGGKLGMMFDKPSTRTRVSLEAAAWGLGMLPTVLRPDELQLGRGETVADTARVLSRYLDAFTIRTFSHAMVEEFARHASIPTINALTDDHHPCQALADVMTLEEVFGRLAGLRVAFVGDGDNNVCHSLIEAAALGGFTLVVATPEAYRPNAEITANALEIAKQTGGQILLTTDAQEAVVGVDAIYTDVWTSMGKEEEQAARRSAFARYRVNEQLMDRAAPHAIFLHCLPAHRGEEVVDEVIDGPHSRVWDQAENRLHVEMAALYVLITGDLKGEKLP
jgi:ornithine carbamoyltransferase